MSISVSSFEQSDAGNKDTISKLNFKNILFNFVLNITYFSNPINFVKFYFSGLKISFLSTSCDFSQDFKNG